MSTREDHLARLVYLLDELVEAQETHLSYLLSDCQVPSPLRHLIDNLRREIRQIKENHL